MAEDHPFLDFFVKCSPAAQKSIMVEISKARTREDEQGRMRWGPVAWQLDAGSVHYGTVGLGPGNWTAI